MKYLQLLKIQQRKNKEKGIRNKSKHSNENEDAVILTRETLNFIQCTKDTLSFKVDKHIETFCNRAKLLGIEIRQIAELSNEKHKTYEVHMGNDVLIVSDAQFKVLNARALFMCFPFRVIDISNIDFSDNESTELMFYYCEKLEEIRFGNFKTSNVKNMHSMFHECKALKELDLRTFDTHNVEIMGEMFEGCRLNRLDISSFNTHNVRDMQGMFAFIKLDTLDVSHFSTDSLEDTNRMFYSIDVKTLNLGSMNISNVRDISFMFSYSKYDNIHIDSIEDNELLYKKAINKD